MARLIILGADHDRGPLVASYGDGPREVDPAALGLSAPTTRALRERAAWYERGWSTPEEAGRFDAEGRRLWAAVRSEAGPSFLVRYFSVVLGRLLDPGDDARPVAPARDAPIGGPPMPVPFILGLPGRGDDPTFFVDVRPSLVEGAPPIVVLSDDPDDAREFASVADLNAYRASLDAPARAAPDAQDLAPFGRR